MIEFESKLANQSIDELLPYDVAVIVHPHLPSITTHARSNCREEEYRSITEEDQCMCSLTLLVQYLHFDKIGAGNLCPVCSEEAMTSIYDGIAFSMMKSSNNPSNDRKQGSEDFNEYYDVISFKFNKNSYHLSVLKRQQSHGRFFSLFSIKRKFVNMLTKSFDTAYTYNDSLKTNNDLESLAQQRIQHVLGVQNLKILHKGKIIYANQNYCQHGKNNDKNKLSPDEISKNLIKISNTKYKDNKRNLSLTVMGTRKEDVLVDKSSNRSHYFTQSTFLKRILERAKCNSHYIVFCGVLLFLKLNQYRIRLQSRRDQIEL
jgi:hypothetical protein